MAGSTRRPCCSWCVSGRRIWVARIHLGPLGRCDSIKYDFRCAKRWPQRSFARHCAKPADFETNQALSALDGYYSITKVDSFSVIFGPVSIHLSQLGQLTALTISFDSVYLGARGGLGRRLAVVSPTFVVRRFFASRRKRRRRTSLGEEKRVSTECRVG